MSFWRVLLSIICPPLAVIDKGCGSIFIVFLLWLCGWVPGVIVLWAVSMAMSGLMEKTMVSAFNLANPLPVAGDADARFDLPLATRGTPFQHRAWQGIRSVPRGEVQTYGQLATRIGSAARAVGQACGANPFPLVTPCHRIVASSGLGGFAKASSGYLIDAKRWLIAHEARR